MTVREKATGRVMLVGALALGALFVWIDETWLWAGQPSGNPTNEQVDSWYGAHAARVLTGDVLWGVACAVLAYALWVLAAHHSAAARRWVRASALTATGFLTGSALVAAALASDASPVGARAAWDAESDAFRVGSVLLAAGLVLHIGDRLLRGGSTDVDGPQGRRSTVIAQALAVVLLVVPGEAALGLVVAMLGLAWEAHVTRPHHDEPPAPIKPRAQTGG